MTRTVLKFGGTSVATREALEGVVRIVSGCGGERIVVVSATAGTTDALHDAAESARGGDGDRAEEVLRDLERRHLRLADELGVRDAVRDEIARITARAVSLLRSVAILHECTARTLDAVVAYGERASTPLVAALLRAGGARAEALSTEGVLVTDDAFGHASPLMPPTREAARRELAPRLAKGDVLVLTGYIASTADGVTTTLGRGGSDYSAAVLAAALDADELRIYTDVSGVMSADPRIVKDAAPLRTISYAEAAELAYFGAKVIHPRTVLPAIEARIPVRILNTFAPADPGTTIVAEALFDGIVVKATTSLGGLGLITVQGAGMSGVPGFAARVFDTTAAEKVSVLMISQSSSENSICLVVPADATEPLRGALERMFSLELQRHDVERVTVESPVAIVAAVGEGMRGTPGVAARVFGALGRAKVNVVAIAQGSSELNISLVVQEAQRDAAVRAIHDEFHKRPSSPPG